MSQKLPTNGFRWVEDLSQFNGDFKKKNDENSDIGYFLEVDIDYPKDLFKFQKDLPFLPERKKVEKVENLICSIEDKEKYLYKRFKTSIKSWVKTKKSTQSNSICSKRLVKVIH